MTRSARRFVGPLTFEAITRREVITDQWKPGANADIEHISLASSARSAARRAGDRQHHRQVRQRHRRRLPVVAVPGDDGAGADGAGDEHQHVRAPGGGAESRDAGRARRAIRRARRGLSGVRLDRQGPAGRAGGGRSRPSSAMLAPARPRAFTGRRVLVTAGPTYEDIDPVRYHRQPIERADGLCDRRRGRAARRARHAGDRADAVEAPEVDEAVTRAQRRRDARRR